MKHKYITCYNKLDNYGGNGRKANEARNDHSPTSLQKKVDGYYNLKVSDPQKRLVLPPNASKLIVGPFVGS